MEARRAAGASSVGVWGPAILDTIRNAPAEWMLAAFHPSGNAAAPSGWASGERTMMDKLWQDIRFALRLWRRKPGFAFVAIITLALGVGANTAMFSIVNAVLLRPLAYPDSDRLVAVWTRAGGRQGLLCTRNTRRSGARAHRFESMALHLGQSVNLTGVEEPQRLVGSFVSGSFFDTLGLKAQRGRLFTDAESAPGNAAPVVVLSHHLWRQRFNQSPGAIGLTMTVNGTPLTVVGVLAEPFDAATVPRDFFTGRVDSFLPAAQFPVPKGLYAAGPVMLGIARLKTGVSVAAANADLDVIGRNLQAADPKTQAGRTLVSESAQDTVVGSSRPALLLLFASVGVVLLIACVNVSHLLLARAIDRQKEIALRAALGASRAAVTRQLAVESALMALVATAAGLVLGRWALAGLTWLRPHRCRSRRRCHWTARCCSSRGPSRCSWRRCAAWRRRSEPRVRTSAACCRRDSGALRPPAAVPATCSPWWRWRCRSRSSPCRRC